MEDNAAQVKELIENMVHISVCYPNESNEVHTCLVYLISDTSLILKIRSIIEVEHLIPKKSGLELSFNWCEVEKW